MKRVVFPIVISCFLGARPGINQPSGQPKTIKVIFDTDANNELDDQHALAYLLFNGSTFDVAGITVNATRNGGDITQHYAEAERVMKLCAANGKVPLLKGADGSFTEISPTTDSPDFDGAPAVNFIIQQAKSSIERKLVVIAVGKLTNLALALKKDPEIASRVRLVWLGSNYPRPGEYNLDNDTSAMNSVLKQSIDFEMVTVRYGLPSGSGAVQVTKKQIEEEMPGKGPVSSTSIAGRHGGAFRNFGDYSVSLFDHINYPAGSSSRALFDVVAVAIVKNPSWGHSKTIAAPTFIANRWRDRPENKRRITVWENFNRDRIIADFFYSMDHYTLAGYR